MDEVNHIFRYPVGYHGNIPVVSFVRYYRSMYCLPESGAVLKGWNICFQVTEEADRFLILFNRKYNKSSMLSYRLFKFTNVWCIKLGGVFWDKLGCSFARNMYVSKNEDKSISISNTETVDSKLVQVFGNDDYCVLPLVDFIGDEDIKDYVAEFKDGVCNLIPVLYPGEIRLLIAGNGIYLPINSFYDKIKREVEGDKTFVSIRFNDKDRRIEFIK